MPGPKSVLDTAITTALARRRTSSTLRRLTLAPSNSIDFSSNDYLSLSSSDELRQRYLAELTLLPDFPLGSGGSRLLDGNNTYAESLENLIADFHTAPTALLANSGFDANVAIFSTLPQPGDVIIYDEFIHASVHDGMRASRVPTTHRYSFAHNSVQDFTTTLALVLANHPSLASGTCSLFIALEAIYSMDGDLAPLPAIVSVLDTHSPLALQPNTHLIVDEAHATGVLGHSGRGLVSSLGLESRISIRLVTFGKALAAHGAAILLSPQAKRYLINYARPLIYTTFLSFPALALVRASYSLLSDPATVDPLIARLRSNLTQLWTRLAALQRSHAGPPDLLRVALEAPLSPIFSVETCRPRELAAYCQAAGYLVRPIVPPTVPAGHERVRVCVHSGNTAGEIQGLAATMARWCEEVVAAGATQQAVLRAKL